jgi:hypothetical protein
MRLSPYTWAGHRRLPLAGDPRRGGGQAGPGAHDAGPCRRPLPQETARLFSSFIRLNYRGRLLSSFQDESLNSSIVVYVDFDVQS